jgi:hypothetical protein
MERNNKMVGMPRRNDEITTSNNKGFKKAHWKHQRHHLDMKFFFLATWDI